MFDPTTHYAKHQAIRTYTSPKGAISVITGIGRINYPSLSKPRGAALDKDGKPKGVAKYGCMILLASMTYNVELLRAIVDAADAAFGAGWTERNKTVAEGKRVRVPLKRQLELMQDYPGKDDPSAAQFDRDGMYIRASSQFAPGVSGPSKLPLDAAAIAAIKSGDWCRFELALLAYKPKPDAPNQGVTAYLQSVQFIAPGIPFAGAGTRPSAFEAIDIPAHIAPVGQALDAALFG